MKALIFSFADLSSRDAVARRLPAYFEKAGAPVAVLEVDPKIRRSSGIAYREIQLAMADSQKVALRIKETGDVYQVLVNGRQFPVKDQQDQKRAIAEIVAFLGRNRTAFQKALAKARVPLPPAMRSAATTIEARLREQITAVDEAIVLATEKLAGLRAA